ncbi:MAG: hypothetical protein IBX52_02450 [Bacterioplanes sp.]|nr:hypothetical protein [Bacterioplanes sp.]
MPNKLWTVFSRPLREKMTEVDHRELRSSGFWVGHILMILATIFGVYLAASAGLKQAIIFNEINDTQSNYYLRMSLHDELTENIALLRVYHDEYLSKNISNRELKRNNPHIDRYVWETMRFSPVTLETPSYFLTEVRRFYRQVDGIIDKTEQQTYSAGYASQLLLAQLDHMEHTVLVQLAENAQQLADELAEFGIRTTRIEVSHEQ